MNDGALTSRLEQAVADRLASLGVFRTADVWRHQVAATSGGREAFGRYSPFAFVSAVPATPDREGDGDLRRVIEVAVLIGVDARSAGVARSGDASHKGTAALGESVIAALDRWHPGSAFDCDDLRLSDESEVLDSDKQHAIVLIFQAWRMQSY